MPGLLDIARVITGKTPAADAQKALLTYSRELYRRPLSIKNKLRTQVTLGDESKIENFKIPAESEGVYAGWNLKMDRKPSVDFFEHRSLNQVKQNEIQDDIAGLELEIKHRDWLDGVKTRMKRMGFKSK